MKQFLMWPHQEARYRSIWAAVSHHSNRVRGRDDGTEQKRLPPVPVIREHELVDDSDERGVDGNTREGQRQNGGDIAEEGVPV